jgi:hypothetical protein
MPYPLMLLPPVVATPPPLSTILCGYLKDKAADGERALADINDHVVAIRTESSLMVRICIRHTSIN